MGRMVMFIAAATTTYCWGRLKNSLGVRNSSVNLWIEPLYTLTGRLLFSGSYGDND